MLIEFGVPGSLGCHSQYVKHLSKDAWKGLVIANVNGFDKNNDHERAELRSTRCHRHAPLTIAN